MTHVRDDNTYQTIEYYHLLRVTQHTPRTTAAAQRDV